jgi:ABC-type sugar transport system ATPase subunit/ABC-type sugar transport system substrate-binding protein
MVSEIYSRRNNYNRGRLGPKNGESMTMETNALEIKGISKSFGANKVLIDLNLSLKKGEVHALMGENGAGKSTLIKTISGVHRADAGEIYLEGKSVKFHSPFEAQHGGVATLFQEIQEIPDLTVAENLYAGMEPKRYGVFVDWKYLRKQAQKQIDDLGLNIDAAQKMRRLTPSSRKMVEIIRAVHKRASVVIMDEPTANLNQGEIDALFAMLAELKGKGISIIYISHRIREIFQIADRISILRDGRLIRTERVGLIKEEELVKLMVGRDLPEFYPRRTPPDNVVSLQVKGLTVDGELDNVNFEVRRKEILGIAGLEGSGATSVVKALFGLKHVSSGTVEVDGKRLVISTPRKSIEQGLAYVPEDRKADGLFLNKTVSFNVIASVLKSHFSSGGFIVKKRAIQSASDSVVNRLGIKLSGPFAKIGSLSGGNQQKALVGRWLIGSYKALLLEEPTRGVDIGAKVEIYREINALAQSGLPVLMYSSELLELIGMCDRVVVMRSGKISAVLSGEELTEEKILEKALGVTFKSVYNPIPESILKDPNYMTLEQFTAKARDGEKKGVYGSGKPIKLAFSQVVMNHPVRINMVETFKANCKKYSNVTCIVTEGNGEVGVEIANIESIIQRKPDVVVVSSLSGTAVYPAYEEVNKAGIPLIINNSGIPDDRAKNIKYTSFISPDDWHNGLLLGQYLADRLNGKGNIIVIEGVAESSNHEHRLGGFMEAINKYPDIHIVGKQSGEWIRMPALKATVDLLQANPKIDGIYAMNDEMGMGVLAALRSAGREKAVVMVSVDGQKDLVQEIAKGSAAEATVFWESDMTRVVDAALAVAEGAVIDPRLWYREPLITKENAQEWLDQRLK